MHHRLTLTLTCALLSARANITAAQTHPIPDNPQRAQTSLGFNPKTRCPDLRIADEGTIATVVFWLPASGIPAQIAIKTTSGSNPLDTAALNCVSKLRFAPATRLGDGEPIDSWQQIAFRWTETPSQTPPSQPPPRRQESDNQTNQTNSSVTVHVCVDETGQLKQPPTVVHSSGKPSLDQAALKIAAAGAPYYHPDTSPTAPAPHCAQLSIQFETTLNR